MLPEPGIGNRIKKGHTGFWQPTLELCFLPFSLFLSLILYADLFLFTVFSPSLYFSTWSYCYYLLLPHMQSKIILQYFMPANKMLKSYQCILRHGVNEMLMLLLLFPPPPILFVYVKKA